MMSNYVPIASHSVEPTGFGDGLGTVKTESFDSNEGFSATDLSTKYLKTVDTDSSQTKDPISSTVDSSKLVKGKNMKSGNKKSFVWKYFAHPKNVDGIEDRSRTECLECKSQLAFNASGTTTTMLNHLKSRHPKIAETEEWRKIKAGSLNGLTAINGETTFSTTRQNESPAETLSPSTSFDAQKPSNSSPDCKNPDINVVSLFPKTSNSDNNYMDQGRLLCLTKLIPHHMMVTSCLPTSTIETNVSTITNNNYISTIQGEPNNSTKNNGNGCMNNANSFYSANRSTVKRKRKKPISIQNAVNGSAIQSYQIKPVKMEQSDKPESSDLASIQSISATSHNSASINNILCNNFLVGDPCNPIYNDNNNNTNSPPFLNLKTFSTLTGGPGSHISSKMGISESDRIIVYWLIKDLRPYSILEETGTKTLFSFMMPSVTIPSITNLKNQLLPSIYWTLRTEIINDFSAECGAGFSIELWDTPTNGSMYASVKLHYYGLADSQLRSKMFTTKEINAKYLCSDLLISCCNEIGIDFKKIKFLPVVMNNPESMRDELANVGEIEQNKKFIIIPCLMSSLQEVVKVGFQEPEIVKLLDKCRALKELAGAYNLQLENISAADTNTFISSKYNSEKFELIYWVFINFDQIVDKLDCFNTDRFNKDDEMFLKQLTPLLEHIYQTLNVIEQNKLFFSASMIKSIILTMNKSPFQPKDDDHFGVIQFKIAVKNRLSKIYPANGPLNEILWISTVLDPRFKKYQDSEESVMLQEIRNQIIENESSHTSGFLQETPNTIKREDLHTIFGEDCFSQEPKSEVDQYINEHKIDIEKNPIKWWQENCSRFPNLSKLALKYLCIPLANQYGLESSETDSVLYSRRKDLDPEEIDHYLFLNHNWR